MEHFRWPVRVYYEDTDAGGIVYYANYLKFFERARTEWLRALGFGQDRLKRESGIVFAVRHVEIDYLGPARLDDELKVELSIDAVHRVSILFRHRLLSEADSVLSKGVVKVACLDAGGFKPVAIPAQLRERLDAQQ